MKYELSYADFKATCSSKNLLMQYSLETSNDDKEYLLIAGDGPILYECKITTVKSPSDVTDFETTYKDDANQPIEVRDTKTGYLIHKPRTMLANLQLDYVYFTTDSAGSLDVHTDAAHITASCPDTTTMYIDFCPAYDYYIKGGLVRALADPTNDIKLDVIAAPDIPVGSGGSFPFVRNKKFNAVLKEEDLGTPPKLISYNGAAPVASKIRIKLTYTAGEATPFEFAMETYI